MKKKLLYLLYSLLFFLPAPLLAQHVVISQVYGGGGNSLTGTAPNINPAAPLQNDFVELYNPTNADVNMTGWSVQYQSATGTSAFSGQTPLPSGSIIKAHGYFLIQQAGSTANGVALPTADYTPTGTPSVNMSGASGKVALCNNITILTGAPPTSTTNVVDFVSYGTVNYTSAFVLLNPAATTNAAPGLNNATSVERVSAASDLTPTAPATSSTLVATGGASSTAGNGYETNVNSVDYILQSTITPHNSSSPTLIAPSVASLNFGTTQAVGTPSAAQSFTIAGVNLTAGATITVAAPFSVSTSPTGPFSTSATLTPALLATTTTTTTQPTVYIEFTPSSSTLASGTATIAATGVVSQTVSLTGTGAAAATLTATPTTLAFGNVNAGVPSVKSYTLSGANLGTNNTTVTATAPYLVSKSSTSGFAASITFTPAELTAATAPSVYVQFTPTAAGAANSTITNTDPDVATGQTVTVTGTGVVPVLTAATTPATSPTSIDFGNQTIGTSATKTFTLSGTNLTGTTTVASTGTNSAAYTVSKTSGSGFASSITFSTTEMAANPTVYVQFTAPTTLGATPGTIATTTAGTGATGANVTLTGTSVAAPVPTLNVLPTSLTFSQLLGSTPVAQSYTVSGANLTGNTTITTAAPYSIATSSAGTYGTSITFTTAQLATTQTIYVLFNPTVVGAANGSVSNATAGGSTQTVTLNGTGVGVPVLAVLPNSLSFTQSIAAPSAAQSFSLTGTYLTAAATTVTVAAPYQLSKDGITNWGTSLTYTASDFPPTGTASLNVFVRFAPTVIATGGVNNGTATIVSNGAISQTVTLNGTGVGLPSLTVTPAALTFNQASGSTSAAQTYTLSGLYLTGTTTVATTAPYTVSKDGVTYSTSVTYSITDLASAQTVYVKFAPTAIGAYPATITNTTTGAAQTITLTGNGGNSAPTITAIPDQTICYTTAAQTIALSGITPGLETTQSVVVSVSSNNAALFAQLGVFTISGTTTGTLSYTIANNASGTAAVTVTVKDNGGTVNGGVDTYTRTFNITVNALPTTGITSDIGNTITLGSTAHLTAAAGATTYAWTGTDIVSGQTTAVLTVRPKATTTYTLVETNATGCSTTQTFVVTVNTFSPLVTNNILTPDGDGKNDTWIVHNIDFYPTSTVKVVDKAGKVVFSKTNYLNDWDGTYNGQPLTQGTYYYVIDLGTGAPKYTGYITLIRK